MNQTPEQIARDKIDKLLTEAGWLVQPKDKVNLHLGLGIALRETNTESGSADYILFVNAMPVGVIEAKAEKYGYKLIQVEEQSLRYSKDAIKIGKFTLENEKPFIYESTGTITRFTDYRDPKPRGRNVFSFHKPTTIEEWLKKGTTLRGRLLDIPTLNETGLRKAQIKAINNLETSFKNNKPRALIQMATGAGKTFTAVTFIYRLLKHADAKRILFLVDTKNLGEQAEQEFMTFQPNDDNRKFTELYNVKRLTSSYIGNDSQVCISTIQRVYSILKGDELEESAEMSSAHENSWMKKKMAKNKAMPVEYTPSVPIEQFDFIVIDEAHRSIYNLWKQVLDYFDAFLIGLTATPDTRTFGFFNENVVSQYTYEQSVIDGVNVPFQIYNIETEISKKGSLIKSGWFVSRRDKLTREELWQQEDEDTNYKSNDLDKKVVNVSQIRNIIKEYKQALKTHIYPNRIDKNGDYEVPKTLVFAKTDSHADDIIRVIRQVFNEGNDFCKKITYKIDEDPKSLLNRFRNDYYPRIAVTVDMIATGTDVKPLEVLLFMRDVKSNNYFEQMKGRGTRTIDSDSLQLVSKTALHKTQFVIVDAVGATKSKKTLSRPLERRPSIAIKDLLDAVAMGVKDEDLFLSLASRLIRMDKQITESQKDEIATLSNGKSLKHMAASLIAAFDPDVIQEKAQIEIDKIPIQDQTPALLEKCKKEAQQKLELEAAKPFNGELNNFLDKVRKQLDQIIDSINIDTVTKSEWDTTSKENATVMVKEFKEFLEAHKDEIKALSIFYNQPYNRRMITFKMINEVYDKLISTKPALAPRTIWNAYMTLEDVKGNQPVKELTALISLIRRVCEIDKELKAFDKTVESNFKNWIFKQNAGQHNRFTAEQIDWLRMIKEHVMSSYHIEIDDLDYTPFDAEGGRGKMYKLFGDDMNTIIEELNDVLAA